MLNTKPHTLTPLQFNLIPANTHRFLARSHHHHHRSRFSTKNLKNDSSRRQCNRDKIWPPRCRTLRRWDGVQIWIVDWSWVGVKKREERWIRQRRSIFRMSSRLRIVSQRTIGTNRVSSSSTEIYVVRYIWGTRKTVLLLVWDSNLDIKRRRLRDGR